MLGALDDILIYSGRHPANTTDSGKSERCLIKQPGNLNWVCFLPWRTSLREAKRYKLLPKKGNLIIYKLPTNILSSDPLKTLNSFEKIKQDFETYFTDNLMGQKNNFLGISAGTIPAIYFANRFKSEKLTLVCPTDKLGKGIFQAKAAKNIRKELLTKNYTAQEYDYSVAAINPINNIENLPTDTSIYLANFDKFVPAVGGNKLAVAIQKKNPLAKIKKNYIGGHVLTILLFGLFGKK
jgi:hypothetical protein